VESAPAECRFCLDNRLLREEPLFSNDTCYFLPGIDPVLQHSGMVIPFRHSATPFELNQAEWRDTFELMEKAKAHFEQFSPDGFTLGWNVGEIGGQTVGHVHLHVIARFADEPFAGQGLRHHIKLPGNRRPG
jgi:diadenosine tetraphosphate (Ap4A) HIT family hydrolase